MGNWSLPRGATVLYSVLATVAGLVVTTVARLSIAGARGRTEAVQQLPDGPVIVIANHTGYADGILLALAGRRLGRPLRLLATSGVFSAPVVGWVARRLGFVPVHRNSARAGEALVDAIAALEAGEAVALFPEGGITTDAERRPGPGKTGAVRLAIATGAPIVPIAMVGAHRLAGKRRVVRDLVRSVVLRPHVDVAVGEPMHASDLITDDGPDAVRAATDEMMRRLTELIDTVDPR